MRWQKRKENKAEPRKQMNQLSPALQKRRTNVRHGPDVGGSIRSGWKIRDLSTIRLREAKEQKRRKSNAAMLLKGESRRKVLSQKGRKKRRKGKKGGSIRKLSSNKNRKKETR